MLYSSLTAVGLLLALFLFAFLLFDVVSRIKEKDETKFIVLAMFMSIGLFGSILFLFTHGIILNQHDIAIVDNEVSQKVEKNGLFLNINDAKVLRIPEKEIEVEKISHIEDVTTKDNYLVNETFSIHIEMKQKPSNQQKTYSATQAWVLNRENNDDIYGYANNLFLYVEEKIKHKVREMNKVDMDLASYESVSNQLSSTLSENTIFNVEITYLKK